MSIREHDLATTEQAVFDRCAELFNAANAFDAPTTTPTNGTALRLLLQHGWDGRAADWFSTCRDHDGTIVGFALVGLPQRDNLDKANVSGVVDPGHRRGGHGSALLDAALTVIRGHGRTIVHANSWQDTAGSAFLARRGFDEAGLIKQVRLIVHDTDWDHLESVHTDALWAARDYELRRAAGPVPESDIDDMVAVYAAMNDSPPSRG